MIQETTKIKIIKELNTEFSNTELLELYPLFEKIISFPIDFKELAGINDRFVSSLNTIFDINSSMRQIYAEATNIMNCEAVFRLLLSYSNPDDYISIFLANDGFSPVLKSLDINPNNYNYNSQTPEKFTTPSYRFDYIARTYQIRNSSAHACVSWNTQELFYNIHAVLYSIFYCIKKNKKRLEMGLNRTMLSAIDVTKYMHELERSFKEKMKRYIDLNGEENLDIADRVIYENIEDDEDDSPAPRKGTINAIRKSQIPEKKMILLGEAGTGKSTTMEYLAYVDAKQKLKDNNVNIPVLLSMGLLTDANCSLKDYISKKLGLTEDTTEQLLIHGKLNLFFDALNEIPNDYANVAGKRVKEIQEIIHLYPDCFYIISFRPDSPYKFASIPQFALLKMDDEQLHSFLKKNTDKVSTITTITDAICQNKKLYAIVRTPLMLSRLIFIVDATGTIPNSEGEIIAAFIDNLFMREHEKGVSFDTKKAKYLLRRIAYECLENSSTNAGMTEETILHYMKLCMNTYCFTVDSFEMINLFLDLGIISKKEELYQFSHQAYQDYFYALEELSVLGL